MRVSEKERLRRQAQAERLATAKALLSLSDTGPCEVRWKVEIRDSRKGPDDYREVLGEGYVSCREAELEGFPYYPHREGRLGAYKGSDAALPGDIDCALPELGRWRYAVCFVRLL